MSTLQFPANPVIGDTYDWDAYKYVWDGEKWKTVGIGYNPVNDLKEAITELGGELDPTAKWSAVPAHSDAEIGGPMNAQAEALAARTKLLHTEVMEALRRSYADAGYNLVGGSFEAGGTVSTAHDVLLSEQEGKAYSWGGALPKVVAPGSTPDSGWVSVANEYLRTTVSVNVITFWERACAAEGHILKGSFEDGATLTAKGQALVSLQSGKAYAWTGVLPKTVPANSSPASSGGIAPGAWTSLDKVTPQVYAEDFGCATSNTPAQNATYLASAIDYCVSSGIKTLNVATVFTVDDVAVPIRNKTRVFLTGKDVQGLYRRASIKGNEPSNVRSAGEIRDNALMQFTAAVNPIVVMMGDSISGYSVSDCTPVDSMWGAITQNMQGLNGGTVLSFHNRGIGGQVWANANGLPSSFPAWYTDTAKPWLDYIKDLSPDLLFLAFGMNDAQNFDAASMHSVLNKIQAWPKVPSIVLVTTPNPAMSTLYGGGVGFYDYASQEGRDYVAGYTRAAAYRYGYGLLDFNRQTNLLRDGRDITSCPMGMQVQTSGSYVVSTEKAHEFYFNGGFTSWPDNNQVRFIVGSGSEDWVTVTKNGTSWNITARTAGAGNYEIVNYTAPAAINSLSVSVTSSVIVVAVNGETEIARFKCLRHGGEFFPRVSYPAALAGPFSTYVLSLGKPERVEQTLFDDDIFGTPGNDAASKPPYGGNGVNHYSSQGVAHIVRPVVAAARLAKRSGIYSSGPITPSPTNITVTNTLSAERVGNVVTLAGMVAVGGTAASTLICTLPVGFRPKFLTMISVNKLVDSVWSASRVLVNTDGTVTFYETAPASAVNLCGSFSVI